ncbi:hypothetical protein [Streptomyces sp. NPDC048521]|uniref:hypothetical protein n=1 Tax=Streptomyces sp. NPDC048521 TaxID=3365566 RepID=UPI0037179FCE
MTSDHTHLDLCPDCQGLRVSELTSIGIVDITLGDHTGPAELFIGPAPSPCDHAPAETKPRDGIKVISPWMPTCDSGRHMPPHPDQTCEEADEWIAWRDQAIGDLIRRGWQRVLGELRYDPLADTVFAAPTAPAPDPPQRADVQRALDILRPHLAWDHRYREQP